MSKWKSEWNEDVKDPRKFIHNTAKSVQLPSITGLSL